MVKARNKSTSDVHEALEVLNDNRRRHGSDRATGAEITRVHEQLRREREMREKAERRADQAEENVRQMEATLGELRYSNRKLQEKLEARAEKSRESLASLRSGALLLPPIATACDIFHSSTRAQGWRRRKRRRGSAPMRAPAGLKRLCGASPGRNRTRTQCNPTSKICTGTSPSWQANSEEAQRG